MDGLCGTDERPHSNNREYTKHSRRMQAHTSHQRIETLRSMQFNWISRGFGVRIGAINDKKNTHINI